MSSLRWRRVGRFSMKNKNRLWITVPVSGLITLYVIRLIKVWITTITNNKSNLLDLLLLENIIVLVTFFSAIIFLLKVGLSNNKKQKIISILIIICFRVINKFSTFFRPYPLTYSQCCGYLQSRALSCL